jgi:hypothetical protein
MHAPIYLAKDNLPTFTKNSVMYDDLMMLFNTSKAVAITDYPIELQKGKGGVYVDESGKEHPYHPQDILKDVIKQKLKYILIKDLHPKFKGDLCVVFKPTSQAMAQAAVLAMYITENQSLQNHMQSHFLVHHSVIGHLLGYSSRDCFAYFLRDRLNELSIMGWWKQRKIWANMLQPVLRGIRIRYNKRVQDALEHLSKFMKTSYFKEYLAKVGRYSKIVYESTHVPTAHKS